MSELVPTTRSSGMMPALQQPGLRRDLARLECQTLVRMASVQAESYVQTEKLHEIDHLTHREEEPLNREP